MYFLSNFRPISELEMILGYCEMFSEELNVWDSSVKLSEMKEKYSLKYSSRRKLIFHYKIHILAWTHICSSVLQEEFWLGVC